MAGQLDLDEQTSGNVSRVEAFKTGSINRRTGTYLGKHKPIAHLKFRVTSK